MVLVLVRWHQREGKDRPTLNMAGNIMTSELI